MMANKRKYFSVAQVIKILTDNADLGEELTSGAPNQAGIYKLRLLLHEHRHQQN